MVIPMKKIPEERMIPDVSKVREIDLNPPIVLDKTNRPLPKISKEKKKKDKMLEQKKPVAKFICSKNLKAILTLGRLSSFISLYDYDLQVIRRIVPQ